MADSPLTRKPIVPTPLTTSDNSPDAVTVRFEQAYPQGADHPDSSLTRNIILRAPDYSTSIGRASSTGNGPHALATNALFESRVVSRDHAFLQADPKTRHLLITDNDSMHGTHLRGRRLKGGVLERLHDLDRIVFGAEVARANDVFSPVWVIVSFTWSDESAASSQFSQIRQPQSQIRDYSEEEGEDYASDVSSESDLQRRLRINKFAVPESDISDDEISILSESEHWVEGSPTSSPIDYSGDDKSPTTIPKVIIPHLSSPALGGPATDAEENKSYYEDSSIFEGEIELDAEEVDSSAGDLAKEVDPQSLPALHLSPPPRPMREPSPSDAAMVKPIEPPFESPQITPADLFAPNASLRNSSAWAGHNSILYDPFPESFIPETYYYSDQPNPHEDFSPMAETGASFSGPAWETMSFGPVSASQITDYNSPDGRISTARSKKRKADDMVEGESSTALSIEKPVVVDLSDLHAPPPVINQVPQPVAIVDTIDNIKSPAPAEPARKKLKACKGSTAADKKSGSSLKKYAATALAGAAVGAMGTIWGLVALPNNFFA